MTRPPVVLVAHPSPELYGSDRVMLEGVSGLVEAGARVVLTLPEDGPGADEARRRGAEVELCPTLVLRKALLTPRGLPVLVRDTVRGLARGLSLARRVRPDVVYVSTMTIPLWTTVARLRRVRSVVHVHEAESTAPRLVRWALAVPVALGRRVVANSRFSIGVLGSVMPRLAARTRLLPNAVPGPAEPTPGRPTLEGPLRVLYVGRLSPRKGVDVAVRAVARLVADGHPAELDLVGAVFAGYEWYETELDDLVHELGLDGAVRRRGFVDDVWGPLAEADVVVVPSRLDEPFGNTAVEAILACRPVVASATSGLLEATRGYAAARTVRPGDPEALADALADVAAHWPRLREAAIADATVAQDRHSPAGYRAALARLVLEGVPR